MPAIIEHTLHAADFDFRVRVYPGETPNGSVLVWLHGGGFMFGSFLNIIAVAPAIIYWVSLRPRLLPYSAGNRPRGPQGGW